MASYITTLQDDDRVNDIIPRTTIPAIADSNGNYLDDGLAASDINKLKNGEINKLESNLAQIETSPSTHAYSAGEFLVYNGILYKAKTSIAVNDSLVVGSNISAQTVSSAISDITTLDTYTGTIPTYGGTVYAYKVGRVCFLKIDNLGSATNITGAGWKAISLGLPSRFNPINECLGMLNFSGGEDSSAQFLCHFDKNSFRFYCYSTVTSGKVTFCYITES